MKSLYKHTQYYLSNALVTQVYMTLCSLPFIAYWGLPFSLISIAGNIIHGFFLAPFLFLSSLIFFAELIHLPIGPLVWLLSRFYGVWSIVLSAAPPSVLIGIRPVTAFTLILCAIALVVGRKGFFKTSVVCAFLASAGCILHAQPCGPTIIDNGKNTAVCTYHNDGTVVIEDKGLVSRTKNTDDVVEYTILPHIRRYYGTPRTIVVTHAVSGKRIRRANRLLSGYKR